MLLINTVFSIETIYLFSYPNKITDIKFPICKTYDNTKKIFGKQNNLPHFSYNIRISKTNWPTVKITNLSISFKPNDKMIKKASVNKNKIIFLLTLYTI